MAGLIQHHSELEEDERRMARRRTRNTASPDARPNSPNPMPVEKGRAQNADGISGTPSDKTTHTRKVQSNRSTLVPAESQDLFLSQTAEYIRFMQEGAHQMQLAQCKFRALQEQKKSKLSEIEVEEKALQKAQRDKAKAKEEAARAAAEIKLTEKEEAERGNALKRKRQQLDDLDEQLESDKAVVGRVKDIALKLQKKGTR